MKSKVGQLLQVKTGHQLYVLCEIPKKDWANEFVENSAVKKVYGVMEPSGDGSGSQLPHIDTTKKYERFCSEIVSRMKPDTKLKTKGDFEEIVKCSFESNDNKVYRKFYLTDDIRKYTFQNCEIAIAPYYDGITLSSIIVNDDYRNKGIGTDVMNKLYDISEELSIPIYLNPFPAGTKYEPTEEKSLVNKLREWYSKIGFAPIKENHYLWNNFE
jgi:GNAT superfamily N-acetyltransferase